MQIAKRNGTKTKRARVQAAADGLRRIVQALRVSSNVIESELGLSGAQLFALQKLDATRGFSISELAVRTRTDPSSVSVVVSRLAARGFVVRATSSDDGRRRDVRLSEKGRELLARAPEPAQARLVSLLEAMSEPELVRLGAVFEKLASGLGAAAGSAPMFFEAPSDPAPRAKAIRRRASAS